jgi:hypothetical protein
MGEPPVLVGAVQLTSELASPEVPLTADGAPGTVAGTTPEDAAEAAPVPTEFEAVTLKV